MNTPLMAYNYDNFEVYNPTISLNMIVWSLCVGIILGAIATYLNRRFVGALVRKMAKEGITEAGRAMTLDELGAAKNPVIRLSLREGKPLRKLLEVANPDEALGAAKPAGKLRRFFSMPDPEPKTDWKTAKFYLPEEKRIGAEIKYEEEKAALPKLALSIALVCVIGYLAVRVVPDLFQMADNFLTIVRS